MPLSMTFLLKVQSDLPQREWPDKLSRALYLAIVKAVGIPADHLEKNPSPFTISPVMPAEEKAAHKSTGRKGLLSRAITRKGARFHLRITWLEDQDIKFFMAWMPRLEHSPVSVEVGGLSVLLERAQLSPALTNKWNGHVNYRQLYSEASDSLRTIILKFYSSTSLMRQEDIPYPLPDPYRLFSGYFDLWEAFSGIPLAPGLRPAIKSRLALVDFRLRKRSFLLNKKTLPGFRGSATFYLDGRHPESVLKGLNVLAEYSFFCGTGIATERGMGVTRRIQQGSRDTFNGNIFIYRSVMEQE